MSEEVEVVTPLEMVQRLTQQVGNTKAWALAKAESIEKRITDVGGEVPAALAGAIAELRAVAE
jgi:hypothetical protein